MLSEGVNFLDEPKQTSESRLSRLNLGPSPKIRMHLATLVGTRAGRVALSCLAAGALAAGATPASVACVSLACASVPVLLVERPWASKRPPGASQDTFSALALHAALLAGTVALWFYGLSHAGLIAAVLVDQGEAILAGAAALRRAGSPVRGALAGYLAPLVALFLLFGGGPKQGTSGPAPTGSSHHDHHDGKALAATVQRLSQSVGAYHWGVAALVLALVLTLARKRLGRRLSLDLGEGGRKEMGLGARRTFAMALPLASLFLFPAALYGGLSFPPEAAAFGVVSIAFGFYIEQWAHRRIADSSLSTPAGVFGSMGGLVALAASGLILGTTGLALNIDAISAASAGAEAAASVSLASPVTLPVIAAGIISVAAVMLVNGAGPAVPELPHFREEAHALVESAAAAAARNRRTVAGVFHQVMINSDSRRIFAFLCINFTFMFVEFVYGFWTNSLSLISDASHMLFDCMALAIGLVASVVARWSADDKYTYGYGRFEVLSGFCNGLLLLFIAFMVLMEGLERLFDPPEVHTENLLLVAVLGFCVNIVGLVAFHDFGGDGHGHSHAHNDNMHGVFLHILADTLGSLGVIVSAILMQFYNFRLSDPIASLFISVLISLSVIPLMKHSGYTLLQRVPAGLEARFDRCLQHVLASPGVLTYRDAHCWLVNGAESAATVTVQVHESVAEQKVLQRIFRVFKDNGIRHVSVQVEKGEPLNQLDLVPHEAESHGGHSHSHGGHDHSAHGHGGSRGHDDHHGHHGHDGHDHDHDGHDHHGHDHGNDHHGHDHGHGACSGHDHVVETSWTVPGSQGAVYL